MKIFIMGNGTSYKLRNNLLILVGIAALLLTAYLFLKGPDPILQYGPENEWPHVLTVDIPSDWNCTDAPLSETGILRTGERAINFTLQDQNEQDVELCQFYGNNVILFFSSLWCIARDDDETREIAQLRELEDIWERYKDEGLVIVMLMQEGAEEGEPATLAYTQGIVDRLELTFPVLLDTDREMIYRYFAPPHSTRIVVLDKDLTINSRLRCPGAVEGYPLCAGITGILEELGFSI